ncbi:hypothetical protein BVRB_2g035480 [Beta vulgaris subsp. vulgaris]|nr:hypothetical protein BVRB_2g035480 [Beta vulgaris subsp. vulgaris]
MVALASLPYPFATFITYKAHKSSRITMIRSSIRVPSSSLRRTKRKNYLRPKILKTFTKPYNVPLKDPIVAPIQPIEPNIEVSIEPTAEELVSSFVEELETTVGGDGSGMSQVEVVRDLEARNSVGFGGFSGRTVIRIVGSFVGLFILQTVVTIWVTSSDSYKEKDGNLVTGDQKKDPRLQMREAEVGIDGNAFIRNWAGVNVDEAEMKAKITEIRKMASEVREAEKKKKVENGEADFEDVSDDEDDSEDVESDNSRINSGIVKEVDGRLSKLRKRYSAPPLNVNLLNKSGEGWKEGENEGLDDKKQDNMLFVKKKDKFRGQVATTKDKPKGFQITNGVREKQSNMDDEKLVERTEKSNDVNGKMNVLDGTVPEKDDNSMDKEEKIPVSQKSTPSEGSRKMSENKSAEKKLDEETNSSIAYGSNGTPKKLSKGMNGGAKPERGSTSLQSNRSAKKLSKEMNKGSERGLVQDSGNEKILGEGAGVKKSRSAANQDKRKLNKDVAPTTSETFAAPQRKDQPNSDKLRSNLTRSTDKNKQENVDPWWSRLPYVLVILMQKGIGSEAQRGFYNIGLYTDAEKQSYSSYTVAFEDQNDAKNFSYLLELAFEDLPDAAVDVAPLSNKDFKEVAESLDHKVIVLKKGELKLYAGQPLADVEAALRSLVK